MTDLKVNQYEQDRENIFSIVEDWSRRRNQLI